MSAKTHLRTLFIGVCTAALLAVGMLSGCGGGAQDRSSEVEALWAAYPDSAGWDMTIRGVVAQSKFTGEHDADFTIYLTHFSSTTVPGFSIYRTIDVRNEDTMDFANRVNAFFATVTNGTSLFPGVQDLEGFMRWYVADMSDKYFIRLRQDIGTSGKSTWTLIAADKEPTSSTLIANAGTEIPLEFDATTGEWSTK